MNVYLWTTELDDAVLQSTWLDVIHLGTEEVWSSVPKITITFDKHSSYDFCSFSESSIEVPVWTKLLVPTITLPIDTTQPFYLDFYKWNSMIKRVTVYNGYSWQYVYTPVSVYINGEFWYRQEWEIVEFTENSTVLVETTNSTTDKSSSIEFIDTYATFKSSDLGREFDGQWKLFSYGSAPQHWNIYWDRSTNSLQYIWLDGPNGESVHIDSLTGKEWYKVTWLTVIDNIGQTWVVIDSKNSSYVIPVNSDLTLEPKVIEWISYPYYWFDWNHNNATNLWWEWWMNSNQQFTSYVSSTVSSLTWGATSSVYWMYWSYNELFYVEWLDNSWAVETQKMYCFMQSSVSGSGGSYVSVYFLVDVTNLIWTTLTYTPYSKGVTVSSASTLWQYVMSELMNWNWIRWLVDSLNSYDFYDSSARDLYQTNPTKYQKKLSFYDTLKMNLDSTTWSLTLI